MNLPTLMLLITFLIPAQSCTSEWSEYKTIIEGPFHPTISSGGFHYFFNVRRISSTRCINGSVQLNTHRTLYQWPAIPSFTYRENSGFGSCRDKCDNESVKVSVTYAYNIRPISLITMFDYVNKNCDKLYWSSWNEDSTCMTSSKAIYSRNCTDCDGDVFPFQQYCSGNTTRMEPCQPSWSEWGEAGPCMSPTCNSTGERVRRRKCLYGDGSEADNIRLCSNQLDIMTEQCIFNNTSCLNHESTSENITNIIIFVIIGVVLLFVLFFIVLCTLYYNRHSKELPTDSDYINRDIIDADTTSSQSNGKPVTALYTVVNKKQNNKQTPQIHNAPEPELTIYVNDTFSADSNPGQAALPNESVYVTADDNSSSNENYSTVAFDDSLYNNVKQNTTEETYNTLQIDGIQTATQESIDSVYNTIELSNGDTSSEATYDCLQV